MLMAANYACQVGFCAIFLAARALARLGPIELWTAPPFDPAPDSLHGEEEEGRRRLRLAACMPKIALFCV